MTGATDSLPLNRRAFLSAAGALVVTLAALPEGADAATETPSPNIPLTADRLDSYISIAADGSVMARYGKIDGGQGLETAIAQMVAEELDVALDRVHVLMGDSATTLDMGGASA